MIKVKLYYQVTSNGDGSYRPRFFTTATARDQYIRDEEEFGSAETCESDGDIEFLVDENGNISEEMPAWLTKPDAKGKTFLEQFPNHNWREFDVAFRKDDY